jgi:hypothetical protein
MRKIQVLRHGLCVIDVIERAAAVLGRGVTLQFGEAALVPELHGEADNGAALLLQECGDSGRIDTAGHSDSDKVLCIDAFWNNPSLKISEHLPWLSFYRELQAYGELMASASAELPEVDGADAGWLILLSGFVSIAGIFGRTDK